MSVGQFGSRSPEHGGGLLLGDVGAVFLVLNDGRHRFLRRIYGGSEADDNVLTVVTLLLLSRRVHGVTRRVFSKRLLPASDRTLAAATVRELVAGAAGPAIRKSPWASTLLLLAVATRVALRVDSAGRALRALSNWLFGEFHHRYGYLVDPGHRRERKALRRAQARDSSGVDRPSRLTRVLS